MNVSFVLNLKKRIKKIPAAELIESQSSAVLQKVAAEHCYPS